MQEYCDITLVEIELRNLVSPSIIAQFHGEFSKRAKKRKEKAKLAKRDKKVDDDYMYVLYAHTHIHSGRTLMWYIRTHIRACHFHFLPPPHTRLAKAIFLSDTRAVVDERNAREAAQLEELFNGPALGRTVTTSSSDSPEGENSCEDEAVRAPEQKGGKAESITTAAKEERSFAKITQVCFYSASGWI